MRIFLKQKQNKTLADWPDEALIAAFQETKNNTFAGELFNRYVHLVYGAVRYYGIPLEDSQDMVMEVFEKVLIDLPEEKPRSFNNWLHIICRNACISRLRKEKNKPELENFEKNEADFMEFDPLLRLYEENPDSITDQDIEQAILKLEDHQKTCIQLFFFEQKSYKEICAMTGYDLKQVKSFLQNGKRRLEIMLKEKI